MRTLDECVDALVSAQKATDDAKKAEEIANKALKDHPEFFVDHMKAFFSDQLTVQVTEPVTIPVKLSYLMALFPKLTASGWGELLGKIKVRTDLSDTEKLMLLEGMFFELDLSLRKEAKEYIGKNKESFQALQTHADCFEVVLNGEWTQKIFDELARLNRLGEASALIKLEEQPKIILKRKAR
jgi:hypothetical protein